MKPRFVGSMFRGTKVRTWKFQGLVVPDNSSMVTLEIGSAPRERNSKVVNCYASMLLRWYPASNASRPSWFSRRNRTSFATSRLRARRRGNLYCSERRKLGQWPDSWCHGCSCMCTEESGTAIDTRMCNQYRSLRLGSQPRARGDSRPRRRKGKRGTSD